MDYKELFEREAAAFIENYPGNTITEDVALTPDMAGLKICDAPIFNYGDANDAMFETFLKEGIIGPHHFMPHQWLPSAKSVISFFLPYTAQVRTANKRDYTRPATEWLHARIEGQEVVAALCAFLQKRVQELGGEVVVPLFDKRFHQGSAPDDPEHNYPFTSNWSERHCAHVCGLGTFSLSRGMITRKGIAGRFGSLITSLDIEPDVRAYTEPYEYCIMCGTCAPHCPPGAIELGKDKNQVKCSKYVATTRQPWPKYYGCGKCQVGVPCETRIPKRPAR